MQQFRLGRILFFACLAASSVYVQAQEKKVWAVNLQKEYNKSYPVGTNMVSLANRFGKLDIQTWDKNEVKLEARISVSAQGSEYAQKMLDRISITDEWSDGAIRFKTLLEDNSGNWSNNEGGHEMRIDWVVHLPATTTLYADNRFGPITIGDYKGIVEIQCRYGNVTTGQLSNRKLIQVEFGRAETGMLSDSTRLILKYSKADIAGLGGVVKAELQFCNSIDLVVNSSLRSLDVRNNYTSLYLVTPKDFSADYNIVTNHSIASGKNGIDIKELQTGASNASVRPVNVTNTHRYIGSLGKTGGASIEIRSNFGNVRIM